MKKDQDKRPDLLTIGEAAKLLADAKIYTESTAKFMLYKRALPLSLQQLTPRGSIRITRDSLNVYINTWKGGKNGD